jgi:hypothetical protein
MAILIQILVALAPYLFQFLGQFLKNMDAAGANEPSFTMALQDIIRGVEVAHPGATGDEKFNLVFAAGKNLALSHGKTLKDSLLNAMIEVGVQNLEKQLPVPVLPPAPAPAA